MKKLYWQMRASMQAAGLWPQGWVARGACYSLASAIGLFALEMVLRPFAPAAAGNVEFWVRFLLVDAVLLFSIVAFRWLKRKLLWRLRNRLIVTYVFIGVIPAVLLIAKALITIYLFAGQFASFVVTSEINSQLRSMQAANAAVGNELAARLEKGEAPTAESLAGLKKRERAWGRRYVAAWHGTRLLPLNKAAQSGMVSFPDFLDKDENVYAKAIREGQPFKEIVRDNGELYLRATSSFSVGN
jgi:sigma-B regulation protein RsbU (phosphoserine phosphatase)